MFLVTAAIELQGIYLYNTRKRWSEQEKTVMAEKPLAKRVHIISRKDGWVLKKEGAGRASRIFQNKDEAVATAKKLLAEGSDVIIHQKDGSIQDWLQSNQE
jgi:hypothetical protein